MTHHRRRKTWLIRWCLAIWLAAGVACAPSVTPLQTAVSQGHMDVALQYALGNEALEEHLAALIVERAAVQSDIPKALILALPVTTRAGRDTLWRLTENRENPAAAQLARIALADERPLQRDKMRKYLNSPDSDVRALAATRFSRTLSPAERIAMTRDLSDTVRSAAVSSLCQLPAQPDITAAMVERLTRDPVAIVRAAATRCPLHLGKHRSQLLKDAVSTDANAGVRTAAIQGLVSLGDPNDIVWLIRFISGPMTPDKVVAAVALARRGYAEGSARLGDALESQNPTVVAKAASLVYYAELPDARTLLIPLLNHSDADVAITTATQLLTHHQQVSRATAVLVQHWKANNTMAQQALVDAGHPEAIAHVRRQLAKDSPSLSAVRRHGRNPVFRAEFVHLLAHPDASIRLGASIAVLQIRTADR